MKILISPAKSLDFKTTISNTKKTQPIFIDKAKEINEVLKSKSPKELSQLMKISDNLSELNWKRNQDRTLSSKKQNDTYRAAIYAFNGDVYAGLDAYTLDDKSLDSLQEKLRILSGLYGLLKPLDQIEAYRLEMGTKMKVGECDNLYSFWKPLIVPELNKEMKDGELLINLASNEYFTAIDKNALKATLITPEFKELKDGKLKTISFFAKKARGKMVRYIIDNNVQTIDDLIKFNIDGYAFSDNGSTKGTLLFTR